MPTQTLRFQPSLPSFYNYIFSAFAGILFIINRWIRQGRNSIKDPPQPWLKFQELNVQTAIFRENTTFYPLLGQSVKAGQLVLRSSGWVVAQLCAARGYMTSLWTVEAAEKSWIAFQRLLRRVLICMDCIIFDFLTLITTAGVPFGELP